jgi:hypothetical protein
MYYYVWYMFFYKFFIRQAQQIYKISFNAAKTEVTCISDPSSGQAYHISHVLGYYYIIMIMYYYVFFYSWTFESRGRIEIAQTISTTTTKTLLCSCFPQVACMMAYVLFMLLCLPFERRETYCFSLIFSSASASSASSQRSHHNFFVFSLEVKGQYGMRDTALWSCTHIPNIIDPSRKTKTLWPGQENTISCLYDGLCLIYVIMSPLRTKGDILF